MSELLTEILPRVHPSDAHLLKRRRRAVLNSCLLAQPGHHRTRLRALALAIFRAYEQVADDRAIPAVERLARGERLGADPEVRDAAARCLEFLRLRAERKGAQQTLLRAAAGETCDALLRAADAATAAPAEQLLRAGRVAEEPR